MSAWRTNWIGLSITPTGATWVTKSNETGNLFAQIATGEVFIEIYECRSVNDPRGDEYLLCDDEMAIVAKDILDAYAQQQKEIIREGGKGNVWDIAWCLDYELVYGHPDGNFVELPVKIRSVDDVKKYPFNLVKKNK